MGRENLGVVKPAQFHSQLPAHSFAPIFATQFSPKSDPLILLKAHLGILWAKCGFWGWWAVQDLNLRPLAREASALPLS
jgi:hypothetical protein